MPKDRKIADCAGLIREARARGAEITRTTNGHYKIVGPAGMAVVSPNWGDPRARQNSIADVRRHAGIDVTDTPDQEAPVPSPLDIPAKSHNGHPTHYVTGVSADDVRTLPVPDPAPGVTRADHDELLAMLAEQSQTIEELSRRLDRLGERVTVAENSVDALATELAERDTSSEAGWIAEMRARITAKLEPFRAGAYLPRVTIAELMGIDDAFELKRLSYVLMMLRDEGVLESTGTKGSTRWRLTKES